MNKALPKVPPDPQKDQSGASLSAAELFQECFHEIARGVGRLGVHVDDVEDAVQDVFLVVHRCWDDFKGRSARKTWLWGIALQTARHYRRQRRNRGRRWLFFLHDAASTLETSVSPFEQLQRVRAAKRLEQLLERLSEGHREIFVLVTLQELSVAEAARLLQVPVTTAHSRYNKACKNVEQLFERERLVGNKASA